MPTNACSKPSTNNYAVDLGAGPAIHKTGKQISSQRELCQKFVSAPPRKALAVVSSRAPLPSSPVAPADYNFRYLLLIGEKERLGFRRHVKHLIISDWPDSETRRAVFICRSDCCCYALAIAVTMRLLGFIAIA